MSDDLEAVTWRVDAVVSVTDGDTARLIRSRRVNIDGRHYRITDDDPRGVAVRLMWLDTPERGDYPGWGEARTDLNWWLARHASHLDRDTGLTVLCYESGGWDRIMGDLIAPDGTSASQWMMLHGNGGAGWPAYVAP